MIWRWEDFPFWWTYFQWKYLRNLCAIAKAYDTIFYNAVVPCFNNYFGDGYNVLLMHICTQRVSCIDCLYKDHTFGEGFSSSKRSLIVLVLKFHHQKCSPCTDDLYRRWTVLYTYTQIYITSCYLMPKCKYLISDISIIKAMYSQ